MLFAKTLKFIRNLFSTSKTDDCKKEFVIDIYTINIAKLKVSAITLIALGFILLIVFCTTNNEDHFIKPHIYFEIMYSILILSMTIFLLIIIKLEKDTAKNVVSIRIAQILFIGFILLWCAGISLLHQLTNGQIIIYIAAIISIAGTLYIEPPISFLIYSITHLVFLHYYHIFKSLRICCLKII